MRALDVGTSIVATLTRGLQGLSVGPLGPRPEQPLVLYEFESCPFCRKVREALTVLDLEAEVRPCPKGGHRYRDAVVERGGKAQFPYLVDPNTGREMYESEAILEYLFERYGGGKFKLNFHQGWHFVATQNFKPQGEPRWQDLPDIGY